MKAKTICKILIILLFFVVVFLLLLDLTCYSLRGTVIKSDKILVLSVDPSEEDFLNKHPGCETIHVQKPEIDRNIYEVGDRVIVNAICAEQRPLVRLPAATRRSTTATFIKGFR